MRGIMRVALLALFGLPATALAYPTGNYISLEGGAVLPQDSKVSSSDLHSVGIRDVKIKLRSGFLFGAAVGTHYDNNFRLEGELVYRRAKVKELKLNIPPLGSFSEDLSGRVGMYSVMGNVLYDFFSYRQVRSRAGDVVPYAGVGIGVTRAEGKLEGDSDNDYVFSYQGIVGLRYVVSAATSLTLDYRYFATTRAKFDGDKVTLKSNNIMAGIQFDY